ncbi:MAG: methyl-accepting chemotaxis protein, partial [Natronospirillum sp.]
MAIAKQLSNAARSLIQLTVVQRIVAGFILLGIGLVVVAFVALRGVADIQSDVNRLVGQAGPVSDQANELSLALARVDQLVLAHFNTESTRELSQIEADYAQERDLILSSFDRLIAQAAPLTGSAEIVAGAASLQEHLPELFQRMEDNQRVYRDSLQRYSELDALRATVRELAANIDQVMREITANTENQQAQSLMYQAHVSLSHGANLANQAGASRTVAEYQINSDAFRNWMNSYGQLGFQLLRARNTDPAVDNGFEDFGNAVSAFLSAASGSEGLLPTVNDYRQIRASLGTRLEETQRDLASADALLAEVRTFANDYRQGVDQDSTQTVGQTQWVVISTSVAVVIMGMLIALLVTRSIRRPLKAVVHSLGRIADGDLTETWPKHSRDEFGALTQSAEQVVHALRSMVTTIQQQSDTLQTTVNRARDVATRMQTEVSSQREQTEWVANAIHEMAATVDEVAKNADQASNEMTQATEHASHSQGIVAENQATISDLVTIMLSAVDAIQNLDQEVHTIQDILQVIEGIAEQTNLLALNAAIEAARAGEQGRGFAVVADEVRSLASRTQSSTVEIKHKIDTMLGASTRAVNAIEQGQAQTKASAERSERALSAINEFAGVIARIRDLNRLIATSAEEQAQASGEINQNVTLIAEVAEKTEQGARESWEENSRLTESYEALCS